MFLFGRPEIATSIICPIESRAITPAPHHPIRRTAAKLVGKKQFRAFILFGAIAASRHALVTIKARGSGRH
jgi:hypothetical protein